MTPQELLERFCKLRDAVCKYHGYRSAADCICGKGGTHKPGTTASSILKNPPDHWRDEGEVMEFIERVVANAMEKGER